ncbi:hypothetical protein NP493_77g01020 [Ridgeia piscesae]|uniref:Uncharacterized protein n=1 Tax=Ridgeia piscesae TaxID=27915 RepID=A0AAD9P962_RIDPI|nr:hypothetical protein NP493_77g01020 [Ridgeia piscesae]
MFTVFRHRLQHLVCQMLLSGLPSIGIKCTMKKLLTLLHVTILSFCNIHNILQDLHRNVHNPVRPVSYRNH